MSAWNSASVIVPWVRAGTAIGSGWTRILRVEELAVLASVLGEINRRLAELRCEGGELSDGDDARRQILVRDRSRTILYRTAVRTGHIDLISHRRYRTLIAEYTPDGRARPGMACDDES